MYRYFPDTPRSWQGKTSKLKEKKILDEALRFFSTENPTWTMLELGPAHSCAQSAGTARDLTRRPARISTTVRESEIDDGTSDLRLHAAAESETCALLGCYSA